MPNGFWNQVLRKTDRHYTAFTIPGIGQLQWTVTSQGLCGAPAACSRLMNTIMEGASNLIRYVDNVLIHSATHEAHIAHLRHAIQRTHRAGLALNPKKCIFGSTTVEYIGHTISSDGVRPGKDKTQAMKDITEPKTMKQLKSFIGLANYFRSYVKGFARVVSDLNALTRQNTKWKEADGLPKRSKEAFEAIKAAISSRPVMAYPNNDSFHLYVDAALGDSKDEGGLGAALWQEDKHGIKQVIGYTSRRLTTSEKNYPAFLAEMQAAVHGMTYFQHYLVTRKFTLCTDHKPLCKLSSTHVKTLNRLQLDKCIFGSTTVEYLGHTISSDGVRPGKDKTQAMKDITEPKTMKQLKSFIGLANYFRSYVKGFARVASDLNALTRQNTKWKEADGLPKRSKEAFEAIKAAISSRPVMAYPNNNGRFHLYVNAALGDSKDNGGLGAAL
jgi:ribonuclease HI